MLDVLNNNNIKYTAGDTFNLLILQSYENEFEIGSQIRFVVAPSENSNAVITKTVGVNSDLTFNIVLSSDEKAALKIGEYVYKIVLLKNNTVDTQIGGYLSVKWGV